MDERTDIVIDGFMRSGNTFSVVAFQLAQNDHARTAHHVHAAAHLMTAGRLSIPTLVTVRPPEPTIISAMLWDPLLTPSQWLRSYAEFYETLLPIRDRFLVVAFEAVTSNFGVVIRRVNRRFGTEFKEFDHSPENVATCFSVIEERSEGPPWAIPVRRFLAGTITADQYFEATDLYRRERTSHLQHVSELRVPRPSLEREGGLQNSARSVYLDPSLARLRRRAEHAYNSFFPH